MNRKTLRNMLRKRYGNKSFRFLWTEYMKYKAMGKESRFLEKYLEE
jgi:hypothetical protein